MHHYIDCGLPNVYLQNGFSATESAAGLRVTITDLYGLHHCIATWIVEHQPRLRGLELEFLRKQFAMTQAELARLLGCGKGSVWQWEREGESRLIPKSCDRLMRLLYQDYAHRFVRVRAALDRLNSLGSRRVPERLIFEDTQTGWQMVAKQWRVEYPPSENAALPEPVVFYTSTPRTGTLRVAAREPSGPAVVENT